MSSLFILFLAHTLREFQGGTSEVGWGPSGNMFIKMIEKLFYSTSIHDVVYYYSYFPLFCACTEELKSVKKENEI